MSVGRSNNMKIRVYKSPKFFSGILRRIFRVKTA
jgi:hypothetical protein